MDLLGGIRWRYRAFVQPHLMLHRGAKRMLARYLGNRRGFRAPHPVAFLYADPTNSGDYAAYLGVRQLADRPGVELFTAPVATRRTLSVLKHGAHGGRPWQAVFVCGGSHLQGCFDPLWDGLLALDLPLVLFGVGAAEELPDRRLTRPDLVGAIARKARVLHVRDKFTRRILEDAGAARVSVAPCPSVCYLARRASDLARRDTHLLHAIHDVDLGFAGVSIESLRARVRNLAHELDLVYDETRHMESITGRLLRRYARAAVVVSSRLHGCIFSYAIQKPFLALVCDKKLGGFMEAYGAPMPSLAIGEAERSLQATLLRQAMETPPSVDLDEGIAANGRRMREIVDTLS